MPRYFYIYGCKTANAAYEAMIDAFNAGELSYGEMPEIQSYQTKDGRTRYGVTVKSA